MTAVFLILVPFADSPGESWRDGLPECGKVRCDRQDSGKPTSNRPHHGRRPRRLIVGEFLSHLVQQISRLLFLWATEILRAKNRERQAPELLG